MSAQRADLPADPTVLVLQVWGIGDLVMTLPVVAAMRRLWPHARIIAGVAGAAAEAMARESGQFDEIRLLPVAHRFRLVLSLVALRRKRIDLAFLATRHRLSWVRLLRHIAGIRLVASDAPGASEHGAAFARSIRWDDPEHRTVSNELLFRAIVPDVRTTDPRLDPQPASRHAATDFLERSGLSNAPLLIGVHPGSEPLVPQKRYPTTQLIDCIRRVLSDRRDARVLVFFGGEPEDDRSQFRNLDDRVQLVEDLPLSTVTGLIERCSVFVSGDTGLAHIAAATGVPCVVAAGPTQVDSTRPLGSTRIVRASDPPECMPCYGTALYGNCSHVSCMVRLAPADLVSAVAQAIAGVVR